MASVIGVLLLLLTSLVLASAATFDPDFGAACDFYVSTTGSDAANCVTGNTPCQTMAGAISKLGTNIADFCFYSGSYKGASNIGRSYTALYLSVRGQQGTEFDCEGLNVGFKLLTSATFTFSNLTIKNCNGAMSSGNGGAIILSGATLTTKNVVIQNGTASGFGGGIYSYESTVTLRNTTFRNCNAASGGAIAAITESSLSIFDCSFLDCLSSSTNSYSAARGGAIYLFGGQLVSTNSAFLRNIVDGPLGSFGGAIYAQHAYALVVTNNYFELNTAHLFANTAAFASGLGGAIYYSTEVPSDDAGSGDNRNVRISDSTFVRNGVAMGRFKPGQGMGGAIYFGLSLEDSNRWLNATVQRCTFFNNYVNAGTGTQAKGGAIFLASDLNFKGAYTSYSGSQSFVDIVDSSFTNNVVTTVSGGAWGGAIHLQGQLKALTATIARSALTGLVRNSTFVENIADFEQSGAVVNGSAMALSIGLTALPGKNITSSVALLQVSGCLVNGQTLGSGLIAGGKALVALNGTLDFAPGAVSQSAAVFSVNGLTADLFVVRGGGGGSGASATVGINMAALTVLVLLLTALLS
eukprot:TRINITY_DN12944_c0_g1_i1.p1 TRINITY_DN12944_c0_g1~~TRINITY_DN12944_c0_g1_i1.p1  ORF type:complete len:580 (+),score=140.92 TRINITY_DN12944_c0_g1_i1:61-1800(+)